MSRRKTLFKTKLTDTRATDVEGVGVLREDDEGNIYRWVKNDGAAVLVVHETVCYDVTAVGSAALFESVGDPVTNDLMLAAGICVTGIAISGGICYGWIQVQGYHKDAAVLGVSGTAVAVGDQLIPANGVGTLIRTVAVGTAPSYPHTFFALETCSDDTGATYAKDVYVKCL